MIVLTRANTPLSLYLDHLLPTHEHLGILLEILVQSLSHPSQSTPFMATSNYRPSYFKTHILAPLESRSLLAQQKFLVPLSTPSDHAEALSRALKLTRRRQRNLANTPEIGLGTGFRLQKAAKKEWERKVYSLEVEKVKPTGRKTEFWMGVTGINPEVLEGIYAEIDEHEDEDSYELSEDEENEGPEYDYSQPGIRYTLLPAIEKSLTDPSFFPPYTIPDICPSPLLPRLLLTPSVIPPHLRSDPRTDTPFPLPSQTPPAVLRAIHESLSSRESAKRWAAAIEAEKVQSKLLDMEAEEIKQRKTTRRDMYRTSRENAKRLKDDEMKRMVERDEGVRKTLGPKGKEMWGVNDRPVARWAARREAEAR